jgi:hypothetical protein
MKSFRFNSLFILIILLFSAVNVAASPFERDSDDKKLIEIEDKYNEVKLGMTEKKVYMIFSENVREIANQGFEHDYKLTTQDFTDSQGNFIIGESRYLPSNTIEIPIEDIEKLDFSNGKLSFEYQRNNPIIFEDIRTYDGMKALNNFYVEDLERFVVTFNNYRS